MNGLMHVRMMRSYRCGFETTLAAAQWAGRFSKSPLRRSRHTILLNSAATTRVPACTGQCVIAEGGGNHPPELNLLRGDFDLRTLSGWAGESTLPIDGRLAAEQPDWCDCRAPI